MSKFFLLLWMFVLLSTAAQADSLSITFNNKSGQVVSAITATPKSGGVAQNL